MNTTASFQYETDDASRVGFHLYVDLIDNEENVYLDTGRVSLRGVLFARHFL